MLRSYRKEITSNAFIVNGTPVQFEPIGDGTRGVLTLDSEKNAALITALDAAAAARRGGIVRVSEQEVADLKKKLPYSPSRIKSRNEMLRPAFQRKPQPVVAAAAVANAKPSLPIILGVAAPANAAPVPAAAGSPPPAPAAPPEAPPAFKPATRRIRRNPSPLEQPPSVAPDVP